MQALSLRSSVFFKKNFEGCEKKTPQSARDTLFVDILESFMCRWGFLKMEDPHNHRFLDQNCIILDDLGLDFRNPPDLKGFADLARIIGARYILCRCAAIRRS